ncbi:head maturation protease, ClpP-related [Paracoccus sp. IB05]|uniref:head maturation protease, ClpP-related n=1 Tax=Paracoccus sp. IB05 TaxID=2779367 RepID=UPI0018E73332|nr:head maturation protease, ClpP-related [Paracoccus sp. IB05]MBJ2150638.1 Clp protease ClpP [Paracoccus sp. IB05]
MNELVLYGTVGSSWWEEEYFTAKMVREALAGMSGPLTVRINSGGGIATEGQAIYAALRGYEGQVNIVVEGVAASAASLIAMAGETITMTPGALLMIHDPASWYVDGRGTEDDHLKAAKSLGVIANAYAGIYAKRAGLSVEDARAIMKDETYYDPQGALDAGFATDLDDDSDEAEPAAFDYRIYQHAPERLLTAAGAIQRQRPTAEVFAMMTGTTPKSSKPKPAKGAKAMANKKPAPKGRITGAKAKAEGDDPKLEEDDPKLESDGDEDDPKLEDEGDEDDPKLEDEGDEDDPEMEEDDDAVAILDLVLMHGDSTDVARDFLAKKSSIATVVAHYRKKGPSVTKHKPGGPTARITRDECDTRRIGMTEALAAQFGRRAPKDDRARQFMTMSLVEMAAMSLGHKGPMRTAYDREQVFMAMHTTSDFPLSLQNALNKELESRYREAEPTYRLIARQKTFRDFRPHPMIRPGDFPTLQPIGEAGEIKYGTIGEKAETVALSSYGIALAISRQTLINDDISAIADMIADQGRAVARFEDNTFYAMMLGGAGADGPTLLETTRQVFNATDGTKAAAAAAINVTSLSLGRAAIMKRKTIGGNDLGIVPTILLVGPDKLTEAQQIVAPIQADQAGNVNPFAGQLQVIPTAKVTGNAWYLFVDPADVPNFVYGYLEGAAAPRTRMEEPFGRQGMQLSLEHDFGVGAIDFRGGYKNAGA